MVLRYLVAFALWEAANSSLVALSTSFLIFELDFTSQEVCVCVCVCAAAATDTARPPHSDFSTRKFLFFIFPHFLSVLFCLRYGDFKNIAGHEILVKIRDILFKCNYLFFCIATPRKKQEHPRNQLNEANRTTVRLSLGGFLRTQGVS
jgi:hypothetical protein